MSAASPPSRALASLLALSGAGALVAEVVWSRRLALVLGSTGLATTLTLALYMAGLGLGGAWAGRRRWDGAPAGYGKLELLAASWAALFPLSLAGLSALSPAPGADPLAALPLAAALLLPPAFCHGATLAAAAAALDEAEAVGLLYAANTAGAVGGTLLAAFVLLPGLGLRGAELASAALSATAGLGALSLARAAVPLHALSPPAEAAPPAPLDRRGASALLAAAVAGGVAMGLEVAWTRLGALLLGGSVYALSIVLAVFLAGVALGAALGQRAGAAAVRPGLAGLGLGAAAGLLAWRWLPHGLGAAYATLGEGAVLPAGAALLALAMGAAPVASGAVFSGALAAAARDPARAAGRTLAANTLGGVIGAAGAGLWGLPALGVQGLCLAMAALAVGLAAALPGLPGGRLARALPVGALLALGLAAPAWDASLYAVGLYTKLDAFADLSPRAVDRFAHDGWALRAYRDGQTATVAVGQGRQVRWLSFNGKVDASTGDDMPTQIWSGRLPVLIARAARPEGPLPVAVVGLASGVTAGEALDAGAATVSVLEIEPAVVEAARWFSAENHDLLDDPRAEVIVADARAWLGARGPPFAAIISEPSNPWITGVSNLFTREYWALARRRLAADGVFCQWVQLYALPPRALRSLVATFLDVFPQSWLFETIPGADALLIAAPALPEGLPIQPTLDPAGLRRLAEGAGALDRVPLNTDDRPWVEFEAPWWLYRSTGPLNAALVARAAE